MPKLTFDATRLDNPQLRVALYESLKQEGLSDAFAGVIALGTVGDELIEALAESRQRITDES